MCSYDMSITHQFCRHNSTSNICTGNLNEKSFDLTRSQVQTSQTESGIAFMLKSNIIRVLVSKRSILIKHLLSSPFSRSNSSSSGVDDKLLFKQHQSKKFVSLTNFKNLITRKKELDNFLALWNQNIYPNSNLFSFLQNMNLYYGEFY